MISYKIVSKTSAQNTSPNEQRRKFTFEKALKACTLKVGDIVKLRRTPLRGEIVEIITSFEQVTWTSNNSPEIIVIKFPDKIGKAPVYMLKKVAR